MGSVLSCLGFLVDSWEQINLLPKVAFTFLAWKENGPCFDCTFALALAFDFDFDYGANWIKLRGRRAPIYKRK